MACPMLKFHACMMMLVNLIWQSALILFFKSVLGVQRCLIKFGFYFFLVKAGLTR